MKKILKTISLVVTVLMVFTFIQKDTRATNDFLIDDSTKTLTRYNGTAATVVVPDTIENIAANAFINNTSLVSVQLPTGLKTIQNSAFEGCTNLKSVEFSGVIENLETIGDRAFYGCNQLTVNWVIRDGHSINVTSGALQANDHNFLILCRDQYDMWDKITNLDGTYFKGLEKAGVVAKDEPMEVFNNTALVYPQRTSEEYNQEIDLRQFFQVYSWQIIDTTAINPDGLWNNEYENLKYKLCSKMYNIFNVPTETLDNFKIGYFISNDPIFPEYSISIDSIVNGNTLEIRGQKAPICVYISYPNQKIDIGVIFHFNYSIGVKISKMPKNTYYEGDIFDPSGIEVAVTDKYGDISTFSMDDVKNFEQNPMDPRYAIFKFNNDTQAIQLSENDKKIEFSWEVGDYCLGIDNSYGESIPITVLKISATEINTVTPPKKLNYFEGDKFDPTGLVIHVKNNNGSEEDVTYNDDTKDKFSFSSDTLQTSDTKIGVTYDGQTIDYDINVTPLKITDISIKENSQIEYYAGDYFNPEGLVLTLTYNNGTTQDIVYSEATKNDFKFSLDQLEATDKEIKITYQGFEKTLGLTVHPFFIERLELKQAPKNLEYYAKDNFDPSGLIITAYFNNGTDKEIVYDDDTKSQFQFSVNQLKETDKEVKITYQGLELTQQLTVHPLFIESMEIKSLPTKLEYYEEDIFDPSGLILEVRYNSGKEDTIEYNNQTKDDFSFSLKELSLGDEEIEITYQTKTMKQAISVKERYTKEKVEKEEVKIEGQFEEDAYLSIEENQHNGDGQGILKDKLILRSYEVSVVGKYRGELRITFEVGNENNGKKAHILHQKSDGSIETFEEEIKEGKVTVTVHELSPFIIYIDKENENTGHEDVIVPPSDQIVPPSINIDNEELNGNQELTNIKQPIMNNKNNISTGDNETIILYITIGGIGLAGIGYYLFKRKQSL